MGTLRRRWVLAGLLAVMALPGGAAAAGPPDPACDFPRQEGTGGVSACERSTGAMGQEPMLVVSRSGTMFMGVASDKGLYEQPGILNGTVKTDLLRSRDDGRTWQRIPLPGIWVSEGYPYIDPATDRLFVTSYALDLTRCGQPVVYSDDEGDTWQRAARNPGCSPLTLGDWPKIFSGPFKRSVPGRYPVAVYECNFIPNILVALSIGCWRSDDGGAHFKFTGFLPTLNGLCRAGHVQGGVGATIVHGAGRVLANGDVVIPLTVCGVPAVVKSSDEGRTWKGIATGGNSLGLKDVLSLREGLVLAISDHVWSENLAVDGRGRLFFAYIRDGINLMVSSDGGESWKHLGRVSPPSVTRGLMVSVAARGDGEVALAYYGSGDKGDVLGATGINWRGWMTHSANALAPDPVFASAPTSPAAAPMVPAKNPGCCVTPRTFLEYTGVRFTADREVRAAFMRWTAKPLPELVLGKLNLGP